MFPIRFSQIIPMIDTHTHLYSDAFDDDRSEVIERAIKEGVEMFFLPAINSETHNKMLDLEQLYPGKMHAMMGLHPCDVKPDSYKNELEIVYSYLQERKFVAIGEIGIDLYWDKATLGIQEEAFEMQIDWAIEFDIPIVIHARDSFEEILAVLRKRKHPKLRGILHCFTGSLENAKELIDLGFMLGIGGVVTFKNGKIDKFLDQIPLENIVLETDSPYLAPIPHRGKRNESAYVSLVLGKLVDIYKMPIDEIEKVTDANAKKLFQLNK